MAGRLVTCLGLFLALVAPAGAQDRAELKAESERRNRRATALYEQGRYEEALKLYQAAYDLHPEPRYLFNIGLAREKVFDYEGCAVAFRRFLRDASDVAEDVRQKAEERAAACRERAQIPVRFTSAPTNAAIFIIEGGAEGGKKVRKGRTPQELQLGPGTYEVLMELAGYMPHRETITVEPGERPQVDFVLDKLSKLRIEVDPAGAKVKIDDLDWEAAPATREVTPGVHLVQVVKDGYQPETREVRVEPGAEVSLVLSLRPLPRIRTLSIRTSSDVPAAVTIDGRASGQAPVTASVGPGTHRLEIAAPGRLPYAGDVSVPEDRDLELLVHLEPVRSRRDRLIVWSLGGAAGAAAVVGGVFGLLALQDQAAFRDDPSPELERRGEQRAETADVLFGTALVLGGGALLYHWLTTPDPSTARVVY